MSISRRPKIEPKNNNAALNESSVAQFIQGGGAPAAKVDRGEAPEEKKVQLRLLETLIQDIDKVRQNRTPKISRHNWFLEAIHEKLARDK